MSSHSSQNHLTLAFPLKSLADASVLPRKLTALMPNFHQVQDALGTVHYSRFTLLSEKTLLFLADFDGEFGQLMLDLAAHAGPVFDTIFAHVDEPPGTPVASNAEMFVEWAAEHLLHPAFVYTAYAGATAKQIKALAAAAGVEGASQPSVFLLILPAKSRLAFAELQMLLRTMGAVGKIRRDLDKVGTPHFAQFVPLEDGQMGFFTIYDGSLEKYIDDFTGNIGEVFDALFKFTKAAPPPPCRKHVQEFIDLAASANRAPIGLYQSYPGLTVQDVRALLSDSGADAGSG